MNPARGLISLPVIIAILAGLIVIGGGAYYFSTKHALSPVNATATTTQEIATTTSPSIPSVTIDRSSLTSNSATTTISGTADGISSLVVNLVPLHGEGTLQVGDQEGIVVPVVDGRWSARFSYVWSGIYQIYVYSAASPSETGKELANDALTVTNAPAPVAPVGYSPVQSCIDDGTGHKTCSPGCAVDSNDCGPDFSVYFEKGDAVYYWDTVSRTFEDVPGADAATFTELGFNYGLNLGEDATHIYRETEVLPGANPQNFRVLWWSGGYSVVNLAQSGSNLIAFTIDPAAQNAGPTVVPNGDPATFKILPSITDKNPYAADKNNFYSSGSVVPGADPSTIATSTVPNAAFTIEINGVVQKFL